MRLLPLTLLLALRTRSLVGLFCLAAAGAAFAEKADKDKPTNIEANTMFYDDLKQLNIFTGNVLMTKGTITIRAENLTVKEDPEGFQHTVALPKPGELVYFRQKREGSDEWVEAWAERVEYDNKLDKTELFKRAFVKRECDEVTGDYIIYDGKTEQYTVVGGGKAVATPNNPDGRVRAVMGPKGEPDPSRPPVDPLVCRNKNKKPDAVTAPAPGTVPAPLPLKASGQLAAPREMPVTPPGTPPAVANAPARTMTSPAVPAMPTQPLPPPSVAPTAAPAAPATAAAPKKAG